jgi:hypothetical protein
VESQITHLITCKNIAKFSRKKEQHTTTHTTAIKSHIYRRWYIYTIICSIGGVTTVLFRFINATHRVMAFQFNFMSDSCVDRTTTEMETVLEDTMNSIPPLVEVMPPSISVQPMTNIKTSITWKDKTIIALNDDDESESDLIPGVYEGLRFYQ